jgi:hypothetical protein
MAFIFEKRPYLCRQNGDMTMMSVRLVLRQMLQTVSDGGLNAQPSIHGST